MRYPVEVIPACADDPDRWFQSTGRNDRGAQALCATCPIRAWCAHNACQDTLVTGMWAGVYLPNPNSGEAVKTRVRRQDGLDALRRIAAEGGYR